MLGGVRKKSHIQSRSLLHPMSHVICLVPLWLLNGWIWTGMLLDGVCVWHQRTSIESGFFKLWILTMVLLSCERKCTLLEWPGRPPLGFALLVSGAKMRIARARSLGLSEIMSAIWVLEYLLELFLIGYPCSCLRAIAHDLPWSAAACQVRWVIRTWILMAGSNDFSNMKNLRRKRGSSSPKSGFRGKPMEDKRVKMRRSWRRRERSSPSSSSSDSSSSGARIQRRVKKAQKVLERRDPAYRAWRDEERAREREKGLWRQGEALASSNGFALGRCAPPLCDRTSRGTACSVSTGWG